jgi:predicted ATPase
MAGCTCTAHHALRQIVITGGPGAGKTAALEVLRRQVCNHVVLLPEAASILWRGGFPRIETTSGRRATQRSIVHVQIELQRMAIESANTALVVCDRGTLDGLAYWPGPWQEYFDDLGTTMERELARYATVIHLRSPSRADGYLQTALRPESAEEAGAIDERILAAWAEHPHRIIVDSNANFLHKLERTLALLRAEVPPCCLLG